MREGVSLWHVLLADYFIPVRQLKLIRTPLSSNHHVIASVVTVADGWLALTVQNLAAHVLDVGNTLESPQKVAAVMTRKEKMDVVLPHIVVRKQRIASSTYKCIFIINHFLKFW